MKSGQGIYPVKKWKKIMRRSFFYLVPIIFFGISYSVGQELSTHSSSTCDINALTVQDQSQNGQIENSKSSIYFQFNISGLYSVLTDWKNNNHLLDGTNPSGQSFAFGGEVGCVLNKYVQVGLGYEYFFTTKISTVHATGDQINNTFFYGSLKAEMPLQSVPDLSLFIDLDIGSITANEVLENYEGLDFNRTGSTTGYRIMLGAQYFLIDNWSIMAGGGYLIGNVSKVTVNGQPWPDGDLDVSGFTIRFAVNYHIPL